MSDDNLTTADHEQPSYADHVAVVANACMMSVMRSALKLGRTTLELEALPVAGGSPGRVSVCMRDGPEHTQLEFSMPDGSVHNDTWLALSELVDSQPGAQHALALAAHVHPVVDGRRADTSLDMLLQAESTRLHGKSIQQLADLRVSNAKRIAALQAELRATRRDAHEFKKPVDRQPRKRRREQDTPAGVGRQPKRARTQDEQPHRTPHTSPPEPQDAQYEPDDAECAHTGACVWTAADEQDCTSTELVPPVIAQQPAVLLSLAAELGCEPTESSVCAAVRRLRTEAAAAEFAAAEAAHLRACVVAAVLGVKDTDVPHERVMSEIEHRRHAVTDALTELTTLIEWARNMNRMFGTALTAAAAAAAKPVPDRSDVAELNRLMGVLMPAATSAS